MKINNYHIYDTLAEAYGEIVIRNFPKIMILISKFIDERSEILQTKNIGLRLLFTSGLENQFYETCGVEKEFIIKVIKDSPNIDHGIPDQVMPIYNFLMFLSSYYYANSDKIKKLYKITLDPSKFVRMFLVLRIYSICQRQIVAHTPKEDLMEYTIQHLNDRFEIKTTKNIYTLLDRYDDSNNSALNIDFNHILDVEIYKYVSKLIKRIKSMLKNIFDKVLKNHEMGLRSRTEDLEATNEEGKKFYIVSTNVSNTIEILTKKIINTFIQDTNVRENLVKISCKRSGNISTTKVKMVLKSIRESKDEKLMRLIFSNILSYWLITLRKSAEDIHSVHFIKKCASAYSISNTYDQFIISLKKALFEIIDKYAGSYIDTEKKSSLNQLKQAIFLYMVLYISTIV